MKQGRLTNSDLNLEKACESQGPLERALDNAPAVPLVQPPPPFPSPDPPILAWDDEMDAEARLQAYLDRAKEPRQGGFPPFEALSARLGELTAPPRRDDAVPEASGVQARRRTAPRRPASDLDWFEDRFQELKEMIARRDSGSSEIVSVNIKLAEIIDRVDRLSAALPGEKTMAAVETQLGELSRSLEAMRAQSASDANRIARAAKEILAATEKAEEARTGFEAAARHTVRQLGQTVAVSASRAAAVTAEQITAALHERRDGRRLERMENEIRALNSHSRESSERTTAAIERVHETLRAFLEKDAHDRFAAAQRKRAGVHTPIGSGAQEYRIGDDFGSEPERKPRLDTITLRTPPPPDPNLLEALKVASEKLIGSKSAGFAKPEADARPPAARPAPGPAARDEERSLPLFGLAIVAAVLLIASAALYYLQSKTEVPAFHLSVLPEAPPARTVPDLPSDPQGREAKPGNAAAGAPRPAPSLFTAADQNHPASPSQPELRDDLQVLANAASHGDREAQFRIASHFLSDGSLHGDPATAARWLARAASQGHVESQFVLASLYERGLGVPKDEGLARELYRKAASANHIRAMHNLGVLLCAQDTPQDYQEAAAWFASAAMSGLTDSQFNLALLYERGLGLQQNNQKAYFWYQVASLAGDKEATRQAERLKRQLPDAETQAAAEQAGSWRPSLEQLPRLSAGTPARS